MMSSFYRSDNPNRYTPEGHSYYESEARKETGFPAIKWPTDMAARVRLRMRLALKYEIGLPIEVRRLESWYADGITLMNRLNREAK